MSSAAIFVWRFLELRCMGAMHMCFQGRQVLWIPICYPHQQIPPKKGGQLMKKRPLHVGGTNVYPYILLPIKIEKKKAGMEMVELLPRKCVYLP